MKPASQWQILFVGISLRQFEQMKERLGGKPSRDSAVSAFSAAASRAPRIILGVDPSLRGTGYGIICNERSIFTAITQGTIACPKEWERSRCLANISQTFRDLVRKHQPDICIVEGLFFAQNIKTAIIMGEARGAALAAIAEAGLDIHEIAPRKVKQAIVGFGAAQKLAVAKMVQRMLNLNELPAPDAADALALALAYAQGLSRFQFSAPKKI